MYKLNSLKTLKSFKILSKKFFCETITPTFKTNVQNNINIAKKQLFWRIRNMGQLEIELILQKWWDKNKDKLTLEDMKAFSQEVLEMENPDLNNYLVNQIPAPDNLKFMKEIQEFLKH
jgi:succinate dehydrogenase flavin-adding protein (antitoxin of CptAB toxin-antitoxin module)